MVEKQSAFIPYQPSFSLEFADYAELKCHNSATMLFYQFEAGQKDEMVIVVPDGCIDILFYSDTSGTTAMVCGSVLKGKKVSFKSGCKYYGVRILPGYCFMVLGYSAQHFINKEVLLTDVISAVRPMLETIISLNDVVNIVESMLLLAASNNKELPLLVQYALKCINDRNGGVKLEKLAEETGYSTRYINRVFQNYIGINPKLFCRIIRFQHSLEYLFSQPQSKLADLVAELNYYDQSHLLREYNDFCQLTPYKLIQKTIDNKNRGTD